MAKTKRIKTVIILLGSLLAVLVAAAAVAIFLLLGRTSKPGETPVLMEDTLEDTSEMAVALPEPTPEPSIAPEELPEVTQSVLSAEEAAKLEEERANANVVNILFLGVDRRGSRANVYGRTDTMIVATLDKKNGRLKMTSIMRDMYVPVPGHDTARLNSASAYGGPPLIMQALNENFSLNISKYVLVDFRMFEKLVDKLGGVTLYLYDSEVSAANDCIAGLNKERGATTKDEIWRGFIAHGSGNKKLSGKQALGYARVRHMGSGDFQRVTRQFKVLKAIFDAFAELDAAKQYALLWDILPMVETNIESTEILDMALAALGMESKAILNYRLPVDGLYKSSSVKGMSVLVPDIPANSLALHEFLFNTAEQPPETADTDTNGRYVPPVVATPTPEPTPEPSAIEIAPYNPFVVPPPQPFPPVPVTPVPAASTPVQPPSDSPPASDAPPQIG